MADASERGRERGGAVVLDTFGFQVPCRGFHVKANVTRDRRLPVVDEHVLRLVQVCKRAPVGRLREFFGMSRAEGETVVSDLAAKGLLVVEGDDVALSTAAVSMFRTHPDGEPSLLAVEPWSEHVWIELVSKAFVPMPRSRAARNLVEVPPPPKSISLPEDFALSAFQDGFHDYAKRVKQVRDPDRVSIHSIAGVEAYGYGSVPVVGRKVLDANASAPRFEVDASGFDTGGPGENAARFVTLARALADEYGRMDGPRHSAASFDAFERLTGHSVRRFLSPETGYVDVNALRRDVPSSTWFLGASYLERNFEQFGRAVRATPKGKPLEPSLRWLRPSGTSWGLSEDMTKALTSLRALTSPSGHCAAEVLTPRTARDETRRRFSRLFDKGAEAPVRLGTSLEVLVVGATLAMVYAHLPVDARATIAIGVFVKDRQAVQRIDKTLESDAIIWGPRGIPETPAE